MPDKRLSIESRVKKNGKCRTLLKLILITSVRKRNNALFKVAPYTGLTKTSTSFNVFFPITESGCVTIQTQTTK